MDNEFLTLRKKKKQKSDKTNRINESVSDFEIYLFSLHRIYEKIGEQTDRKIKFLIPNVCPDGKKTRITNLIEMSEKMNRNSDHLIQFIRTEFRTTTSMNAYNHLVVRGKYRQQHIESIIRSYLKSYVICCSCFSFDTRMVRENRLNFIECKMCASKNSVCSLNRTN